MYVFIESIHKHELDAMLSEAYQNHYLCLNQLEQERSQKKRKERARKDERRMSSSGSKHRQKYCQLMEAT